MANYAPFVSSYGQISKLFDAIKKASVPPKFTLDFISTKLGLTSSSYRPMIPLLKRLGFLGEGNVPTENYKLYRDEAHGKQILAAQIRIAYKELFEANEYANNLKKNELLEKLKVLYGASKDDRNIDYVAGTFLALCRLADFESSYIEKRGVSEQKKEDHSEDGRGDSTPPQRPISHSKLGISYTINLNLPATTEIEVFNAIFKSLKEHIIGEK